MYYLLETLNTNLIHLSLKEIKPANVMLDWGENKFRLMSTCDLQVKTSPSKFLSSERRKKYEDFIQKKYIVDFCVLYCF